eukprot:2002035-Pyramimonas_sp.AAC.1
MKRELGGRDASNIVDESLVYAGPLSPPPPAPRVACVSHEEGDCAVVGRGARRERRQSRRLVHSTLAPTRARGSIAHMWYR